MFKLISACFDLITLLDSFQEDFLSKKGLTELEDEKQHLYNLLIKNVNEKKDNHIIKIIHNNIFKIYILDNKLYHVPNF